MLLSLPFVGGNSLSVSTTGTFLVFVYIWLPYMILPIQASLERVPSNLIEASYDLGGSPGKTFAPCPPAARHAGRGCGLHLHLLADDAGRFYHSRHHRHLTPLHRGQAVYTQQGTAGNIPLAAAFSVVPVIIMAFYLWGAKNREPSMHSNRHNRAPFPDARPRPRGLLFLHLPILLIFAYAFTTEDKSFQWPPPGFTTRWIAVTWARPDVWQALTLSLQVRRCYSLCTHSWDSLCCCAVPRPFLRQEAITLLVILPIALARYRDRHCVALGLRDDEFPSPSGPSFSVTRLLHQSWSTTTRSPLPAPCRPRWSRPPTISAPTASRLPPCHPAEYRHGPDGRRHARLRALSFD